MKRVTLLLCVCAMAACEMTSSQRYEVTTTAYTTAVTVVMAASLSGNISLEDMETFNVIRVEVADMLVEWGEALERGEEWDGEMLLTQTLNRLLAVQIQLGEPNDGNSGSTGLDQGGTDNDPWGYFVDRNGYLRAA